MEMMAPVMDAFFQHAPPPPARSFEATATACEAPSRPTSVVLRMCIIMSGFMCGIMRGIVWGVVLSVMQGAPGRGAASHGSIVAFLIRGQRLDSPTLLPFLVSNDHHSGTFPLMKR